MNGEDMSVKENCEAFAALVEAAGFDVQITFEGLVWQVAARHNRYLITETAEDQFLHVALQKAIDGCNEKIGNGSVL